MCTFKNAAIALIALVLGLFALAGCEGAEDEGSTNNNGYNEDDTNGSGGEDTNGTIEAGLIVATAPNDPSGKPFVGDFSFDGNVVCAQVSVCEFEATGSVKVEFTHPIALFLNKFATANPDEDTQVSWDQPGDWGLAPNGTYRDDDGQEHAVQTIVEDVTGQEQILLQEDGGTIGAVNGQEFSWEEPGRVYTMTYSGTIHADLATVVYKTTASTGEKYDRTLIRVE